VPVGATSGSVAVSSGCARSIVEGSFPVLDAADRAGAPAIGTPRNAAERSCPITVG
jgi:hypothetical protein